MGHLIFHRSGFGSILLASLAIILFSSGTRAQDAPNAGNEDYEEHEIDEIVVEAAALARTVSQLAQPTTVLGGDNLAKKQSTSIGETVSRELGVSSSYFGPVASRPVIRGQFGERVRVLSNGLDSLDASALSEDHAVSIDSILAERIEIVRGPATLLYGSGAAGGLVNVVDGRIMHQAPDDTITGAVALGNASATGSRSAAARLSTGNERVGLHVDFSKRDTDDVEIPDFAESAVLRAAEEETGIEDEDQQRGVVPNTDSETTEGSAAISLYGDRGYVGASVNLHDSNYGIPGHAHVGEEEEIVRVDLEQTRVDLRGEYRFDGPLDSLRFRVAHNDYRHVELEDGIVGTVFDNRGIDARVELRSSTGRRSEGALGLQFKKIDFDAIGDEAFVPGSSTIQSSLFAFHEWSLTDRLAIQGSGRIENQVIDAVGFDDATSVAIGGSLGAVWTLSDRYTLTANYALTERNPNSTELYADGEHVAVQRIERGAIPTGNGSLERELSSNFDLSLHGDNERVEWTFSAFLNSVDDYILLAPTAMFEDELQVFEYTQTGVKLYGFETEARIELLETENGHLHTRLHADYVYGEERQSGEYLPRLPPLRYGIGLHYTMDTIDAGVEATFHRRQRHTASNELPTGDYVMLNAELSYTFVEPDLYVFIRGVNLADEDARQHSSPLKDTLPLPGRSLQLGVRYFF